MIIKFLLSPSTLFTHPSLAVSPSLYIAHATRVTSFEFHPFALDILVTASPDTLKVWNVSSSQECLQTISITEQCLSMAFSPDGNTLIAALKDKTVSLFDVRTGATLQSGAASHEGIKACRLTWLSSHLVASVGFGKGSQREIRMYNSNDLSNCVSTTAIDTSPSLMETFFDEDTSLLFLAGRGETFISIFEIIDATATFLTRFDGSGGFVQQGFNFFPKLVCDVKQVEIAKCWRVVQNCVEQVSFTVPRLKKEFFQDDIFLPTNDRSKPLLTAADWVATSAVPAWPVVDRVPKDMIPCKRSVLESSQ